MSNPYLSLNALSVLESLADTNHLMITIPGVGPGYVPLSEFRDSYLLTTVNSQISALQSKPANGAFANPITMSFTGVVTGSVSFDGTGNVSAAMAMPDGSIPISAVTDLASTISTIESELGVASLLQSSYFSNIAAASQTTMLGYWNGSTTGMINQDPAGVIFEMSSDGSNTPASGNYVSQLLMGSAGTISWRRNTENGGWEQVQLWHSGNFTPSSYVAQNGVATLGSLTVASASGEADIFLSSNGSTAYQTYLYNSETTGIAGIAITDAAGSYAGPVLSWDRQTGALSTSGTITFPNSSGLQWSGGASLGVGSGGASVGIQSGGASHPILGLNTSAAVEVAYWDGDGNQFTTANITSTAIVKAATGIVTGMLSVGTSSAPLATLDVVTGAGHLLVEEIGGASTIASINSGNTAYAALNLVATAFVFSGGSVTIDDNLTVSGTFSNPSDRRLKTNVKKHAVVPYHRRAPYYTYDRIDLGTQGQGPMAQAIQQVSSAHVTEYNHLNRDTNRRVKRLAIDKAGIALEQAYWASYEVDDLRQLVSTLTKRLDALEAKQKKR